MTGRFEHNFSSPSELINLLAAFVAGAVSILNTRTATRVEIEASLEVAQRFVEATMKDLECAGQDRPAQ